MILKTDKTLKGNTKPMSETLFDLNSCIDNIKPIEDHLHSDKYCVCGGHNAANVKKNKHHHATKCRLNYRQSRRFKKEMRAILEDLFKYRYCPICDKSNDEIDEE